MRRFKLIWLLLTNKSFVKYLASTILYAFDLHQVVNGRGSADVIQFTTYQGDIFTNDKLDEFYSKDKFKIPPNSFIEIITKYSDSELDELKKY